MASAHHLSGDRHHHRLQAAPWSGQVVGRDLGISPGGRGPGRLGGDRPLATAGGCPGDEAFRDAPQPPRIVFVPVPEAKTLKSRVHLDIWPVDRSPQEEVQHLLDRGARQVDVGQRDVDWEVMSDPAGNEFCVMR